MGKTYKTTEQVVAVLKSEAERVNEELQAAARMIRRHQQKHSNLIPYKQVSYRTVAGSYRVRDGEFRTHRFCFDPISMHATSYGWWSMLSVIKGVLVRNECGYSAQTSGHQSMLDKAMKALGIEADLVVSTRSNIGNLETWKSNELFELAETFIQFKYCRADSKKNMKARVNWKVKELEKLAVIGMKFSEKEVKAAIVKAEGYREDRLHRMKQQREHKKSVKEAQAAARAAAAELEANKPNLTLVKE